MWINKKLVRRKYDQNVAGWSEDKRDTALGRVYTIDPKNVECYHLCLIHHHIKGLTSYSFLMTVNNTEYPTFQATCRALGLLEDDNQWNLALEEATVCRLPNKMKELLVEWFFIVLK